MAGKGGIGKWVKFLFTGEHPSTVKKVPAQKTKELDNSSDLPPQHVPVYAPSGAKSGGMLLRGRPTMSRAQRDEIRKQMLDNLGEDGLKALEDILAAPRDLEIKCYKCGQKLRVKPPTSDNLRLQVVELLSKYSVGTRHEEEVVDRFVLCMGDAEELMEIGIDEIPGNTSPKLPVQTVPDTTAEGEPAR